MAVQVAVFADEPSFWRNGDIDIFATYKGAPHARDRLVRNCHLYCAGISERYEHSDENNLIYKFTIDQKREAANQKTSSLYIINNVSLYMHKYHQSVAMHKYHHIC